MKWSMDTHKYLSETVRKALQILHTRGITLDSEPDEIDRAERELGTSGVYKDYDGAKGRIRRALFTYFKSYGCMTDSGKLTEIGLAFSENRISVQELSFWYILNYKYDNNGYCYYPVHLIASFLKKAKNIDATKAYITPYYFMRLTEQNRLNDITDDFTRDLLLSDNDIEVNERAIGYDVWAKMLVQSGIFSRDANKNLVPTNWELLDWIIKSYELGADTAKGKIVSGILSHIPQVSANINADYIETCFAESAAVHAFLFDGFSDRAITKYILTQDISIDSLKSYLGFENKMRGFYKNFIGVERLVGFVLSNSTNNNTKILGQLLLELPIDEELLSLCGDTCEDNNLLGENILLYGVPGCGKSYTIKTEFCNDSNYMQRVVFHLDYTYSDFIGQILPTIVTDTESGKEKISYKFTPGPFTTILKNAIKDTTSKMYYLVIEEINRGNAPAIFGEVFQLLDRKNGESEYGITNFDIAKFVYGEATHEVKIPANLTILATMNTADQNVFTLDTAFKRRWSMRNIENSFENCDFASYSVCGTATTWEDFVIKINEKIIELGKDSLSTEDARLGAFFISKDELENASKFSEKVLMYLWNDAFKYNRDKIFKPEYLTLEQLLRGFRVHRLDVFLSELKFNNSPSDEEFTSIEDGISKYLEGKNPDLVALYHSFSTYLHSKVNGIVQYVPKSNEHITFKANKSIAELYIQKNRIKVLTKVPNSVQFDVGEKVPDTHNWTLNYSIIFTNESEIEAVVGAIIDSNNLLITGE